MQPLSQVFFALLIAHLLGDFPFQTYRMVGGKLEGAASAFAGHLSAHLVLSLLALLAFVPHLLLSWKTAVGIGVLLAGHLLLDIGKSAVIRRRPQRDRWPLFVADQLAHVVVVAVTATIIVGESPDFGAAWAWWLTERDRSLLVATVLLVSVFPTGYLIRYLLTPLSEQLAATNHGQGEDDQATSLANAGLYLGWIERTLLVIAFASGSYAAVAIVIGAKSVARYPEFRSRDFAEYFLIGTLVSLLFAAAGGWAMRLALTVPA